MGEDCNLFTRGSLFSGIGGFDLAAHWMGWQNVFQVEIDPFCRKVLKQHFPKSICYEDIKQTDFTPWRGKIDIVSGGFPCQPYSTAGKRKGDKDDRHLWPEMLRAVGEIQPGWILGENVPGLVNWGDGVVFQQIQADLEAEGYEVFPPVILPACGKEAPHQRERVWIIAHSISERTSAGTIGRDESRQLLSTIKREENKFFNQSFGESWSIADPQGERRGKEVANITRYSERITRNEHERTTPITVFNTGEEIQTEKRKSIIGQEYQFIGQAGGNGGWNGWPTQHPVCSGNDGLSSKLDGITFSKWRQETIKSTGNAVVPPLVFEIFKAIESFELTP